MIRGRSRLSCLSVLAVSHSCPYTTSPARHPLQLYQWTYKSLVLSLWCAVSRFGLAVRRQGGKQKDLGSIPLRAVQHSRRLECRTHWAKKEKKRGLLPCQPDRTRGHLKPHLHRTTGLPVPNKPCEVSRSVWLCGRCLCDYVPHNCWQSKLLKDTLVALHWLAHHHLKIYCSASCVLLRVGELGASYS